jgi:hypothetical protein
MDIEQLRAMGLVIANPLVRRDFKVRYRPLLPEAEWATPGVPERQQEEVEGVVDVWVRRPTAADQIAIFKAVEEGYDSVNVLIHRCVFNEAGARLFSLDEAQSLDRRMFENLIDIINKTAGNIGKKSPPRTRSGAKLRSLSVVGQSESGSST